MNSGEKGVKLKGKKVMGEKVHSCIKKSMRYLVILEAVAVAVAVAEKKRKKKNEAARKKGIKT